MKVSIITAVWNGAKTIGTALESVARQRTEAKVEGEGEQRIEIEHIVVDGGSTDGTVQLIKEFETHHSTSTPSAYTFRWLSEKDNGLYDAINKGIRMATGDVVGICNADDILAEDDVIAKIAQAFEGAGVVHGLARSCTEGGGLDCVYGKICFVKGETTPLSTSTSNLDLLRAAKVVRRCFAKLWRPWMLQWGYMPPHPGVFIRRECFEKWGGYVPDRKEYKIAADYELLIRFFRVHKMRSHYSGICTTVMRTGGVSTRDVNARRTLNAEIIKANRTNGYFCCWPMLLPKYAIKVWEVILPRLGFDGR